jgi:hypothetical protein
MPPPLGHPRYGGRRKGSVNKVKVVRKAIETEFLMRTLDAAGIPQTKLEDMHPLNVIHWIMVERFRSGDYGGALFAATALAPYTNARLSSSEVRVMHTLAQLSDDELHAQALAYEQKLAIANGETIDGEVAHALSD